MLACVVQRLCAKRKNHTEAGSNSTCLSNCGSPWVSLQAGVLKWVWRSQHLGSLEGHRVAILWTVFASKSKVISNQKGAISFLNLFLFSVCEWFTYMYVCSLCANLVPVGTRREMLDPLELEVQMVVNWEPNHRAISPVPINYLSVYFETVYHRVALTVMEFAVQTKLSSSSQIPTCFCLPHSGVEGMHHHTQQVFLNYLIFVVVCAQVCTCHCVRVEIRRQCIVLSYCHLGPRIELRLPSLATSAFLSQAVQLPKHIHF